MAEPVSQDQLQVAVGVGQTRIGSERITEGEMTVECRSTNDADVQVMRGGAGRRREGFAAGNPRSRSCWKVAGQLGS